MRYREVCRLKSPMGGLVTDMEFDFAQVGRKESPPSVILWYLIGSICPIWCKRHTYGFGFDAQEIILFQSNCIRHGSLPE